MKVPKRFTISKDPEIPENLLERDFLFSHGAGGATRQSIRESCRRFMNENFPSWREKSFSIPKQLLEFGLQTQILLFTDEEIDEMKLPKEDKSKAMGHRNRVWGERAESFVFDFLKQSLKSEQMAVFKNVRIKQFSQAIRKANIFDNVGTGDGEIDFLVVTRSKKIIHIEVKKNHHSI